MSTKFFNNSSDNTLFNKLAGIAKEMSSFDRFLAVVGYFRSSGYFKLRKELGDVKEIKILVGINIDDIFRNHNKALLLLGDSEKAKELYQKDFKEDIINAQYSPDVEEGILQMYDDMVNGRLEMRIHATKNLHAKFYLCLPQNLTPNTDGWVIMGSSNISESGLGITIAPRYELNVAMKDYDDVKYCADQFDMLWNEAIPLTVDDIAGYENATYLGEQPTPYELYIKVLIDTFGDQVEDDFSMVLPEGVKDLKYQKDAVIQGYQMLMKHNGLFLADVVGLGKTMIATMIAKRFIGDNGKDTKVLVVYPPALEDNWRDTFKQFGITKKAQFITNGSLAKVLEGKEQYHDKEEFDLIIVDEAHGFRNDGSGKYDELQKICKSPRINPGFIQGYQKKVMLLSATPLNNQPSDLQNLLLLFQDSQNCTIDGIPNLKAFFLPLIQDYRTLMKEREKRDVTTDVDKIYEEIREKVIDKVTVRRTRSNIMNDSDYKADIKAQGIVFPHIAPPHELEYELDEDMSDLFYKTLSSLSDDEYPTHINYIRYRAIEFLKPEYQGKYKNAVHASQVLAGIYRVHMVKRLESSFYAFKKSLKSLLRITEDMIDMYNSDKVIIASDIKVKDLQAKNMELDQIIEYAIEKGLKESDIVYSSDKFKPDFIELLKRDYEILLQLNTSWENVDNDPKFDTFKKNLDSEFMRSDINATGKLVLFSESVDTLNYLEERLYKDLGRTDVLKITADNRDKLRNVIKANFDANILESEKQNKYNIIITSDVLAEGVNLHQSNVIVNYDSPWNATRLMQRIGRVNRIGSKANMVYNYMFYPSKQGDKEIRLKANALVKLQGFHSAFGEDAQIYSREEIVKQFQLFDSNVKDSVDKKIALLREVRDLYNTDRKLYHKIKKLPMKSRVIRDRGSYKGNSIVFISSNTKTEFYLVNDKKAQAVDFLVAINYLKAKREEMPVPFNQLEQHYRHVNKALDMYNTEHVAINDNNSINREDLDNTSKEANNFLRAIKQVIPDAELKKNCDILRDYINKGVYARLPKLLRKEAREYKNNRLKMRQDEYHIQAMISGLVDEYHTDESEEIRKKLESSDPRIIISETFI